MDQNDSSEKKIIFTKYGRDISIDNLSTGEKQIVFRGAYLLKNSNNLSKGIVLIDEPELSMHPKWQEKYCSIIEVCLPKEETKIRKFLWRHIRNML